MSLTLTIVSRQSRALGARATMTFGQDGGTIGRSLQNDWPLPDKQRYLSARHASIDYRSGSYYIVDTSKNGVYINDEHQPVGHGKPQRLFEGDRIRIGEYEIRAAIENVEDTRETLLATSHIDPVDRKQQVEAPDPTGYDLVDAHAMTGVSLEIALEEERSQQAPRTPAKAAPPARAAQPSAELTLEGGNAQYESTQVDIEKDTSALEAFCRGAGIEAPKLDGDLANRLLLQLGRMTRELVNGLIDNTQLRAVQTAQLGIGTGQDQDKDAIQFSDDVDKTLRQLTAAARGSSATGTEAIRKAFGDLRLHQRALLSGNRSALNEYLTRLDPETIELSLTNGKRNALLSAAHRFRYWDVYKDVFMILGNRIGDEWPEPYQQALATAYARLAAPATDEPEEEIGQLAAG